MDKKNDFCKPPRRQRGGKVADMMARRDAACARILAHLKDGPLSSGAIAALLNVSPIAAYRYLAHMRDDLRQIHAVLADSARKQYHWVLGADVNQKVKDDKLDKSFAPRCFTTPARQIGMVRDSLIAALFGAAGERQP